MSGGVGAVLLDGLTGVVGDVDFPALVLQRHADQVCQRAFVVDQQHPDRRTVDAVHPGQLSEDGATRSRALVADRQRAHLPILAIPQRDVTFLIDISYVPMRRYSPRATVERLGPVSVAPPVISNRRL